MYKLCCLWALSTYPPHYQLKLEVLFGQEWFLDRWFAGRLSVFVCLPEVWTFAKPNYSQVALGGLIWKLCYPVAVYHSEEAPGSQVELEADPCTGHPCRAM